jgi:GTPase SAR1 family protein
MGTTVSYLKKEKKILLLGLDCSGKTTIVSKLTGAPIVIPTCNYTSDVIR